MKVFFRVYFCAFLGVMLICANPALGWGPGMHVDLAGQYYADPLIAGFASEFGTDVTAVVNGADDLDFVGDPHHAIYHAGQWLMCLNREYVYTPASPTDWFNLDETTRLKYMMHNLGDVAVPANHSPASGVHISDREPALEVQADLGSYGSPATPGSWYTGKVSDGIDQFYNDCVANAIYLRDNTSVQYFIGIPYNLTPSANANTSAQEAWGISQQLAKAILTDYYLAKRTPADAGSNITVGPGESATFSAVALRDPDNIVWAADGSGTYHHDDTWTGITDVRWDLDGNGSYETLGLQVIKNYETLAAMFGGQSVTTFGIKVTDDEGVVSYDTATLTLIPEPVTFSLFGVSFALMLLRRKR